MDTMEEVEFDYEAYTRDNPPDISKFRPASEVRKERREAFKARLINHINMEIKHAREMRHVFISYCHENKDVVDKLCQALTSNGVNVWIDRNNIKPGMPWKQAIQQAIHHGDFFIACFSKEYNDRDKTFMQKELSIAIEKLQQKPIDRVWFIPIKLNECEIPDINIGEGETLQDLQYVNLYEDWNTGIEQILNIMPPGSSETIDDLNIEEEKYNNCVLFRAVNGQHFFVPFQEVHWDSKEISLTLSPISSEQISFLCSVRKGKHDVLAFTHQEDALWVKSREVSQISTEGKTTWEVILTEDTTGNVYKHRTEKMNFEYLTADQIAYMRAKRLLLDEKLDAASSSLTQTTVYDRMLLEAQIRGDLSSEYGNRLQPLKSPIPELHQHFKTRPETFKKLARLTSILYLKLSNTVEDILQLDLKMLNPTELQVKFKGRRSQLDINKEPILLEFEGICPLPE